MPQPQPPQLDYSPKPLPWHRSRKVRRGIALAAVAALLLLAAWEWGPAAWRQARLYWAQRQCLAYVAPPGQVIYARDPNAVGFVRTEARAVKAPPPNCWVAVEANLRPTFAIPKDADRFMDGPVDLLAPAPVFLHRLRTGSKDRLVAVGFGGQVLGGKMQRVLCCRVIQPGTLLHGPVLIWEGSTIVVSNFQWTAAVRVYAGRADDSDPSHFTIRVDVDGVREVIDGWLQGDDTVKLQVREGPARSP